MNDAVIDSIEDSTRRIDEPLKSLQDSAENFLVMKPNQRRRVDGAVWARHALELIAEVRRLRGELNLDDQTSRVEAVEGEGLRKDSRMSEDRAVYTVEQARAAGLLDKPKRNKYNARKTPCSHDHMHDSALEAKRCDQLHLLQQAGTIIRLVQQPRYSIQEGFIWENHIIRRIIYQPDFYYCESANGVRVRHVIEEVKGIKTKEFSLKHKLFLHFLHWLMEQKLSYPTIPISFRILTKEDIG